MKNHQQNVEFNREKVQLQKFPDTDKNGWTNLHLAAIEGNKEIILEFIQQWPEFVNHCDIYGNRALHFAARWGHTECLNILINQGNADINVKNNIRWTPLHCAVWENEIEVIQSLIELPYCKLNEQTKNGWTCLHFAARWNFVYIAKMLLDDYRTVYSIVDEDGWTVEHTAAFEGRLNFLELLNERGLINVYAKTKHGSTPLDFAAMRKTVLQFYLNINDVYGLPLIHHSTIQNNDFVFKYCLKYHMEQRQRSIPFPSNDFNKFYQFKPCNLEIENVQSILVDSGIVVISGIRGIGKTAFVKNYAWYNISYYNNNLFWIDCTSRKSIEKSFQSIALYLKISTKKYDFEREFNTIVKEIFNHLRHQKGLFVFDNINQKNIIDTYIKEKTNLHIIITTCYVDTIWDDLKILKIQPLSPDSAFKFFDNLFFNKILSNDHKLLIKELIELLDFIPLAINLSKIYILNEVYRDTKQFHFQLNQYLLNFKNIYLSLVNNYHENIIKAALTLNLTLYYQINKSDIFLMPYLCFLNPNFVTIKQFFQIKIGSVTQKYCFLKKNIKYLFLSVYNNKIYMNKSVRDFIMSLCQKSRKTLFYKHILESVLEHDFSLHHLTIFSFAENYKECFQKMENLELCSYLARYGCTSVLEYIFKSKNHTDIVSIAKKYKLLFEAVTSGNIETVKFIYQYDNNLKLTNKLGHTMVWEAIDKNHMEVLTFLINEGASLEYIDKLNKSPLHRAAFLGRLDIVKVLLNKNLDPNIKNKFHRTPLHYAAMEGHTDIIIELLKYNAKINARDHYRRTPLFETIRCNQINALKLFIDVGAKINTKDNMDMTPIKLAKLQKNKNEILKVFQEFQLYKDSEKQNYCSMKYEHNILSDTFNMQNVI